MTTELKAVIFDWAGTMIDFGSRAPVVALRRVFAQAGVAIEESEARADMGLAKRDHIAALLANPRIEDAWRSAHGASPGPPDGDRLFAALDPIMREAARESAVLIPGAAEAAQALQRRGVRLGSCTGYSRTMMADILPLAAAHGYSPECVVCAGETPAGRPSPLMVWKNLVELGVWPAAACIKVDDTEVGIAEGLAAGARTIGVAASGNIVGLSEQELSALPRHERDSRVDEARRRLRDAGAHRVVDTVADLMIAIEELGFQ
jgi:phosphonoacetaldehyde hydrolase